MSTSVEQLEHTSGSPWRKRIHEDLNPDLKDFKKPRCNYFRLESESSKASEEDTESVCSTQEKDTDVVRDTSDTESKISSGDEYEVEVEYEVESMSDNVDIEISTTDSESMMIAAAAAVIADKSLEAWITDAEDSDSSSDEPSFGRSGFSTCVQCKGENLNPFYRYCEKCFQDRKKCLPPRPRRRRRRRQEKSPPRKGPVKLDMLRNCLSGLSQDSGVGSSQESCPVLSLDKIVVPEHLQLPGTSKTEDITTTISNPSENKTVRLNNDSPLKRKRQSSESSLSDFDVVKKPKLEQVTSDLGSEISSTSSFASTFASLADSSSFSSDKIPGKSESDLCMFCNSAPKNSIFLHTNMAHCCCCYQCAKKTLKTTKRCPICNLTVNRVVRIFMS